jgi:hypothetical protein
MPGNGIEADGATVGGVVVAASRGTNHQIAIAMTARQRMPIAARLITLRA